MISTEKIKNLIGKNAEICFFRCSPEIEEVKEIIVVDRFGKNKSIKSETNFKNILIISETLEIIELVKEIVKNMPEESTLVIIFKDIFPSHKEIVETMDKIEEIVGDKGLIIDFNTF